MRDMAPTAGGGKWVRTVNWYSEVEEEENSLVETEMNARVQASGAGGWRCGCNDGSSSSIRISISGSSCCCAVNPTKLIRFVDFHLDEPKKSLHQRQVS
jgi:hypothetical protein